MQELELEVSYGMRSDPYRTRAVDANWFVSFITSIRSRTISGAKADNFLRRVSLNDQARQVGACTQIGSFGQDVGFPE